MRIEKRAVDLPFQKRLKENRLAKQEIARKALEFIKEGDTILLDASSTVLALAEILPDIELTVITNSHDSVVPLLGKSKINVLSTGGKLDRFSLSYGGSMACATVRKLSVDKAFFSCNGLDLDRGASEVAEIHSEFKEAALQYCSERILLCDSSKLGVRSSRYFADFDVIDRVITDSDADENFISKLKDSGVYVK